MNEAPAAINAINGGLLNGEEMGRGEREREGGERARVDGAAARSGCLARVARARRKRGAGRGGV
jgi:hypothetical protein